MSQPRFYVALYVARHHGITVRGAWAFSMPHDTAPDEIMPAARREVADRYHTPAQIEIVSVQYLKWPDDDD